MTYLIRHLAVNLEGTIIAAAVFEKVVHMANVCALFILVVEEEPIYEKL